MAAFPGDIPPSESGQNSQAPQSPMEAHSSYRASDWTPQRLVFHQNLESFAERVGLLVGLQSNGKVTQEQAYAEIRKLWKDLKGTRENLLSD
jgi:hypothetical protein